MKARQFGLCCWFGGVSVIAASASASSLHPLTALLLGQTTAPQVVFKPDSSRSLIYVNNPEQLYNSDLGDATLGNTVIYRDKLSVGNYRNWYEHTNRSGNTIGYAIRLLNTGTQTASIRTRGKGFVTGLQGGKPFSDMLSTYSTPGALTTLLPGQSTYIYQLNNLATDGTFFSAVVDFDVTAGNVLVENIAYRSAAALTGNRSYQGYIQRVESDGTRCSRQYKGRSPYYAVQVSSLNFVINDTNLGPLNVRTRDYNLTTRSYSAPVTRNYWMSNIGPSQNSQAVTNDMLSFNMPGWGVISPLAATDGDGKYPNIGNWAVMYTISGSVQNLGTITRNLSVNLQAPAGGGAPIAYRGNDGVWRELKINAGSNIQYYTFSVAPGATTKFDARYILGGPGAGAERNTIAVNNPVP